MGHVDFTRGWHAHLSLPGVTSPPPRCLLLHQPCQDPGLSIPHGAMTHPRAGGWKATLRGGEWLLGPP